MKRGGAGIENMGQVTFNKRRLNNTRRPKRSLTSYLPSVSLPSVRLPSIFMKTTPKTPVQPVELDLDANNQEVDLDNKPEKLAKPIAVRKEQNDARRAAARKVDAGVRAQGSSLNGPKERRIGFVEEGRETYSTYIDKLQLCIQFLGTIGKIKAFEHLPQIIVPLLRNSEPKLGTIIMQQIYIHLPNICSDSIEGIAGCNILSRLFGTRINKPNPTHEDKLTKHQVCIIFLEEAKDLAQKDIPPIIGQTISYLKELKPETTAVHLQRLYELIPKVCFDRNNDLNELITLNSKFFLLLDMQIASQLADPNEANRLQAYSHSRDPIENQELDNREFALELQRQNREIRLGYF